MNGFYKLDFVPNKIAYIYEETKTSYKFLAFFNEGTGIKAVPHEYPKINKKDFKKIKSCFKPNDYLKKIVDDFLNLKTL